MQPQCISHATSSGGIFLILCSIIPMHTHFTLQWLLYKIFPIMTGIWVNQSLSLTFRSSVKMKKASDRASFIFHPSFTISCEDWLKLMGKVATQKTSFTTWSNLEQILLSRQMQPKNAEMIQVVIINYTV